MPPCPVAPPQLLLLLPLPVELLQHRHRLRRYRPRQVVRRRRHHEPGALSRLRLVLVLVPGLVLRQGWSVPP